MPANRQRSNPDTGGNAPVTVIVGDEELLVERAVAAVVGAGSAQADGIGQGPDVHDVRGADLAPLLRCSAVTV
jgi:hypothetical protein